MTVQEAKKKTAKNRYGDVAPLPTVSVPTDVGLDQLQPGQKQELEIKLVKSQQLVTDVKQQLKDLETAKTQAQNAKNIQMVDQITGLQDNLEKLIKKITARITALKKQLKHVPPDVKVWLDKIAQDCQQYLKEVKKAKRWLYRGTKGPDAFVAKSWHAREPKDSNPEAQVLFDQMLAQMGAVAVRGNSIFATSDFWHTKTFGDKTYIIFPVDGKSHYTYTNQGDIVLDNVADVGISQQRLHDIQDELKPYVEQIKTTFGKKAPPAWFKALSHMVNDGWPYWHVIKQVIMQARKYPQGQVIPDKYTQPDFVSTLITLNGFVELWQPKTTRLAEALEQKREVYVSGVYYALSASKYGDYIAAAFGVPVTDETVRNW